MATPHVSGVAALIAAHEPNLTFAQIKERIVSTAKPMSGLKNKVVAGGMVNAYYALANQIPPTDPNDPSNWASKPLSISTEHPYQSKTNQDFEVKVNGAHEISLYFSRFETEPDYDKVTLLDSKGNTLATMAGNYDDSYSLIITGNYVKVHFSSDDTQNDYGFDLTKVSYR